VDDAVIMMDTKSSHGRLRATREAQGKSLRQLARESEIDPANLSRIERGIQRPSVETLRRIGLALGLKNLVGTLDLFVEDGSVRD
jgi:transcriptional regulator with XRE-family HTH domain